MTEEVVVAEAPEGRITGGRFELPAEESVTTPEPVEQASTPEVKPEVVEAEKPEEKPTEPDPEKRKESRRVERKIGKMYQKMAEATARADLLEKQLNETRQATKPVMAEGMPKLEDFASIEQYAEAVAAKKAENAVKEFQSKQQQAVQAQTQAQMAANWEAKVTKAVEKYEDFDEVVGDLKPIQPWSMAITRAENGDEVAYYLGKNLKEAQRIASLDPLSQIHEIGFLSAKLQLQPSTQKTPSKASEPIKPLTGTSLAESGPNEEQDMATWIKARNKQLRR